MELKTPFLILASVTALAGDAAGVETLTLDAESATRMAIEASRLTSAAEERVEARQSSVKAADAARLPVVSISAVVERQNSVPEFAAPINGPTEPPVVIFPSIENTYSADLSISQPIYTGGAITAGRDGARFDETAATWSQKLTALDLSSQARRLYWAAVAAAAGVDVAEAQITRTQRLLDDARALRAAGMAVNADVFAAEARYSAAEVDLIRTRNEKKQALARLGSLLGIDTTVAFITLKDARTEHVPASPRALADLERAALENRPELRITDARIDGLGVQARAVNSNRKPAVAATGQWLVARPNHRFLPLEDVVNDSWRVGVGASWQIFDGSRTREQVATVHAEQRALQYDRGELERQILLEVATARLQLESALEAVVSADAAADAAVAWEEASSERYSAGLAMLSELLDAQADLSAAEVAQVKTRAGAWMAEAALLRAVGQ
ncbi:MAG: TolC family protein [Acidobacteria bacterium]|jgi:outer membrane protein|nr:TolC family protein [Acidobacteriota bacterium]